MRWLEHLARASDRRSRILRKCSHGACNEAEETERRSTAPRVNQIARATHSAGVKWPGKNGNNFISKRSKETQIATAVIRRNRSREATSQNETHAASQPSADAMEPTSVTGTRMASPKRRQMRVPAVTPRTATDGVENLGWMKANCGARVRRRA